MQYLKSQIVGIVIGLLLGANLCFMWYVNAKVNTASTNVNQIVQYLNKPAQ